MIAVSLKVGVGVRLIKPKQYKHNENGRTAPGVCGNGSVPLSHSGNVVTRIGIHTQTGYILLINSAQPETLHYKEKRKIISVYPRQSILLTILYVGAK